MGASGHFDLKRMEQLSMDACISSSLPKVLRAAMRRRWTQTEIRRSVSDRRLFRTSSRSISAAPTLLANKCSLGLTGDYSDTTEPLCYYCATMTKTPLGAGAANEDTANARNTPTIANFVFITEYLLAIVRCCTIALRLTLNQT